MGSGNNNGVVKIHSAVSAQRDPMNKKVHIRNQKKVDLTTKNMWSQNMTIFPLIFSIRFYNSLYYRTSCDCLEKDYARNNV